tara:strand:+ start:408 stop:611 length:204 start_codon:yes stop_codon:yes gene_type:complete
MMYQERAAENKFQVGDKVISRWIVSVNGQPQTAGTVTSVNARYGLIVVDHGDEEGPLPCRASDYKIA